MRHGRALRLFLVAIALVLLLGAVAVALVPPLRFRAIIVFDKVAGRLDDAGWSDIGWMLSRGNGVDLRKLAQTRNPYEAIESPRRSHNDIEAGTRMFREQCASCHGDEARGGPGGPALNDHVYRQGHSDWALYRTITIGIPRSAMVGRNLPRDDVWRLVSYLKLVLAGQKTEAGGSAEPRLSIAPVTAAELQHAEDVPGAWLMYSGSYAGHRHSRLREINRENVSQLRVEWSRQFSTPVERVETSPIVRGSTMFVTEPPNRVLALDASSGEVLWTYSRDLPSQLLLCCGPVNRGVTLMGNKVFLGTLDAHMVALDADTGKVIWDVPVAEPSKGYSITSAPLAIDDMVVTGVAGGEYGARGFIDAYDAATGKLRWRYYTAPGAGQPGSETWKGNSIAAGGAPTWLTGSFDPESRVLYWGVGNPSPNFYGENREGDNLYSNSIVAIDADTGKLRWYFQFTPHDLHDWDSVQIPVLVDAKLEGSNRKLVAWANRNGFYYLLDRTTGKFLLGAPFVKQTWADGLDASGRPRVRPEAIPTPQGSLLYPGVGGGTNWWSPSYDPQLQLMFVPTIDKGGIFYASANEPVDPIGETLGGVATPVPNEGAILAVKAIEVTTGKIRWQHAGPPRKIRMEMGGVMSTAGQLVLGGDGELLLALDARTGEELWRFNAGGQIAAAPVSYELAGRQYIAIAAGRSILAFALPKPVSSPSHKH